MIFHVAESNLIVLKQLWLDTVQKYRKHDYQKLEGSCTLCELPLQLTI